MENNEDDIRTLTWKDHMRLRPEMYIGKLGDGSDSEDGVYAMLRVIINNAVDEAWLGLGNQIEVTLEGNHLTVRNFGRGIPFPKVESMVLGESLHCMMPASYYLYHSLRPIEYALVCALSSEMTIESYRDRKMKRISASRGEIILNEVPVETDQPSNLFISFIPDKDIFGDYQLDAQIICYILSIYAAGTPGLKLSFGDKVFYHPDGMMGLLKDLKDVDFQNAIRMNNCLYDLAIVPVTENAHGKIISIVNGHLTLNRGPLVDTLIETLFDVLSESHEETQKSDICSGFFICLNIKWAQSVLDSITKFKDYFKADLKENLSSIFREDCDKRRAFLDALTKQNE